METHLPSSWLQNMLKCSIRLPQYSKLNAWRWEAYILVCRTSLSRRAPLLSGEKLRWCVREILLVLMYSVPLLLGLGTVIEWQSTVGWQAFWGNHVGFNSVYVPRRTEENYEERAISVIRPVSEPRTFRVRHTYSPYPTAKFGRK